MILKETFGLENIIPILILPMPILNNFEEIFVLKRLYSLQRKVFHVVRFWLEDTSRIKIGFEWKNI